MGSHSQQHRDAATKIPPPSLARINTNGSAHDAEPSASRYRPAGAARTGTAAWERQ